jgi:hypothetical protein
MDYVYISNKKNNEELRYSIRSVEKNMPQGKVWIVGEAPDWYTGDVIPVKDKSFKFNNIRNCTEVAANSEEISDDFVLMNDDFFAVKKVKVVPTYHGGLLLDRISEYTALTPGSMYTVLLNRTYGELKKHRIDSILDYDIHVPMIFNKEKLRSVVTLAPFPRTMYGNKFAIGGEQVKDVKVYSDVRLMPRSYSLDNDDMPYVSSEDGSFQELYNKLLKDMFPDPSKYESYPLPQ